MVWFLNPPISVPKGLHFFFTELSNQKRSREVRFEQIERIISFCYSVKRTHRVVLLGTEILLSALCIPPSEDFWNPGKYASRWLQAQLSIEAALGMITFSWRLPRGKSTSNSLKVESCWILLCISAYYGGNHHYLQDVICSHYSRKVKSKADFTESKWYLVYSISVILFRNAVLIFLLCKKY